MANYNSSQVVSGLGATTIQVPTTDTYKIVGKISLPTLPQGSTANSSVVVTITQTTVGTIYTGVAGARGFTIIQPATANDVFTITLSSANAVDQGTNLIKTTIYVSEGV